MRPLFSAGLVVHELHANVRSIWVDASACLTAANIDK